MLSVVVLKINKSKNNFREPKNVEWNDDKETKLENYVKSITSKANGTDNLFDKIEWPYLSSYLNVGNEQFVKMKVDEIYEKNYKEEPNNSGIKTIIDNWRDKASSINQEVNELIEGLNLENFETSIKEEQNTTSEEDSHQQNTYQINEGVLTDKVDMDSLPVGNEVVNDNIMTASPPHLRMPMLTKTQRRMSLDLLHTVPNISLEAFTNPSGHKKYILSKPASTTTTNVNVITKSEVNIDEKENTKKEEVKHTKRFQDFLRKIKQKITRSSSEPRLTPKSPLIVQLDNKLIGKPEGLGDTNNRLKISDNLTNAGRRLSLVGENLPLYIRQQLHNGHSDVALSDETSTSPLGSISPSLSKKRSRMHNLLENSQSLYSQSKDLSLVSSSANHNGSKLTNNNSASGYDFDQTNDNFDVSENNSDDDKEYILPDLLTRYYGIDQNEEEILNHINNGEEVNDFIHIQGYNGYEDIDEEEESNEDDDYLFKIYH